MDPPPIQPQTYFHNGRSPMEQSQNIIKQLLIKGRGMSLGIDISNGDCPINASAGCLGNAH